MLGLWWGFRKVGALLAGEDVVKSGELPCIEFILSTESYKSICYSVVVHECGVELWPQLVQFILVRPKDACF